MKNKALLGFFIAILLLNSGGLIGQETQQAVTMGMLFNRIQVFCRGGQSHIGLLAGIMDRGLVIRQGGQDKMIPYDELQHVVIERTKSWGAYASSGMILGLYLGNMVVFRAQDSPPFYMENTRGSGIIFRNAVFAAAGGALGYLISSLVEKGESEFDFTGEEKKRMKQWDRLQSLVTGKDHYRPKKIHLTVQGGYVSAWNADHFRSQLESRGYYVSDYLITDSGDWREATKFSLFRKVQLTYSPTFKAEFGLAVYFLGEPAIDGSNHINNQYIYVDQSTDIKGYFAVAAYHPFTVHKPWGLDWSVGIGAGITDVDIEFIASGYRNTQVSWDLEIFDDYHLSKKQFSGVVFTELKVNLWGGMSFGVMADYVYIPKVGIPEFPGAGIPAQNLNLGNASFGFLVGFHF
jgi:hypothetical protein